MKDRTDHLQGDYFIKLDGVLAKIPVSRSTWYQGIKDGIYPPATKLSARCSAWRASTIDALMERLESEGDDQ